MARMNLKGIVALCLMLLLAGCAGSSRYMTKAPPPQFDPAKGKAIVHFVRPSGMGFAINFQVWDRDRFIGLSQAKSYFSYVCEPGRHLFIAIAENRVAVDADLAPGKVYYITTGPRMGGWKARVAMTPVKKGSEYWDTAEAWRSSLEHVAPVESEVARWGAEKRDEVLKLVDFFEKDPTREQYMAHLAPEDGR